MKKIILALSALLLCSCAGINVRKPEIGNVKKIAILSVSGNEEFQDVEAVKGKKETLLTFIGDVIKDNVEFLTEEQVTIVTHGANELYKAFNGIEGWSVVPFEEVIANEEVKAFYAGSALSDTKKALDDAQSRVGSKKNKIRLVTPAGMEAIPYELLNPSGGMYWLNGERVESIALKAIGKLCEPLGVDAIAVAEYTFAYETGMMTKLMNRVTPIILVDVALVDKDGNKIMYTDRGWAQFEGDDSARFSNGHVELKDGGKSVDAYRGGIDKAMTEFQKQAQNKLK